MLRASHRRRMTERSRFFGLSICRIHVLLSTAARDFRTFKLSENLGGTIMSIRLRQICLVANQLAPVIDDFREILGLEVCFVDKGVAVFGLENSLMPVGANFVEVVAPIRENTAAGRYLKRRNGDGGYMVICQCSSQET